MKFKVKLVTSEDEKKELELEATSVQDAKDQANDTYKNCNIVAVDLIPKKGQIRLFSYGDQVEAPEESLYIPF
jgi:hypothetical protein